MDYASHELFSVVQGDFFFQFLYPVHSFFFHLIGHLVGIGCRRRAGAAGVWIYVDAGEADFFLRFQGFLEILFRFPRETDDQVGGQGNARYLGPQFGNEFLELGQPVVAVHAFQHGVGAGLDGQVEMAAYFRFVLHDGNEIF